MPNYRISAGNSTTGPIGFVARLTAGNAETALERLKEALPDWHPVSDDRGAGTSHPIHLNVYFNPDAITLADVEVDE
jgi:hypothetical protein